MLRDFIGKLQKQFSPLAKPYESDEEFEVPVKAVPEGHLVILAVKGFEKKRFIVKIECVNRPEFTRLLEQTEEEYGFGQTGALIVPCSPKELEKILNL